MTTIRLKGVCENNLKSIDLEIPQRQALTICGVSGSGKTSLAFDTLYAEGRRRFIESLSPRIRQNLEKLDRPDADSIENVPAAIAVRAQRAHSNQRLTVGIATELEFYLRKLFLFSNEVICFKCDKPVQKSQPTEVVDWLESIHSKARLLIGFYLDLDVVEDIDAAVSRLRSGGFLRALVDGTIVRLDEKPGDVSWNSSRVGIIVDRLSTGSVDRKRALDSISTALQTNADHYWIAIEPFESDRPKPAQSTLIEIDNSPWMLFQFSDKLTCEDCGITFPQPEVNLFNWNHAAAACASCDGSGGKLKPYESLIIPDKRKSIADGAFAIFKVKPFEKSQESFFKFAQSNSIPLDRRYFEITEAQKDLLWNGKLGIHSIFADVFANESAASKRRAESWMETKACDECSGQKLSQTSLSYRIEGMNIGQWSQLSILPLRKKVEQLLENPHWAKRAGVELGIIETRCRFLESVGLEYISLDRPMSTLSSGESQRVSLTVALASCLVNGLYVLDEPTVGLHAVDCQIVLESIKRLCERGNTVVVVEHNEQIIRQSQRVVEIGPAAGESGGKLVYDGDAKGLINTSKSTTADFLAGRRGIIHFERALRQQKGHLHLVGACGNNLKNIEVKFPLGVLCAVTGVSGAGKTSLVSRTLYGAIGNRIGQKSPQPLEHQQLSGVGQVDEVVMIDHTPVGKSPRSNPATYIKAFDEIRRVFSETIDAKTANIPAGHFSFNVDGGRCQHCEGDGQLSIDMQFMADVKVTCEECQGKRFRKEILGVRYRGKSIADVLEMTAREALSFFRGQTKLQAKLKSLVDVGLEYMTLGQGAHTLSAGESQRLKLAAYLGATRRNKTLFILDEPTSGLHSADVVTLLDCLSAILAVGHSIVVADHNLRLIASADHVIELGPGSADNGGHVVFTGPPGELVERQDAKTGQALRQLIQQQQ